MNINYLFIFTLIFLTQCIAQQKKDCWVMAKENTAVIMLKSPPNVMEGVYIYRKDINSAEFVLLNPNQPVVPVMDASEAKSKLGDDWKAVSNALRTNDPFQVLSKLRSSEFTGGILSFIYPSVAKITARYFLDTTVQKGKEYVYKIVYVDSHDKEKENFLKQAKIIEVKPPAPSNVKYELGENKIKLEWNYPEWEVTSDDIAVQFYVYRKIENDQFRKINDRTILRDDINKPEFEDLWLNNEQTYNYYITAVDPIGRESKPSEIVKITLKDNTPPSIPDNLETRSYLNKIYLSWNMNLELDAAGYNVYRSTGLNEKYSKINKSILILDKPFFTDSLVNTKTQYFYAVTSLDKANNESKKSNVSAVVCKDEVKPEPPNNLTYKIDKRVVNLKWQASNSKDLAGYYIYRGESHQVQPRIVTGIYKKTFIADSGYKGTGLNPGKKYYLSVTCIDSSNNESDKTTIEVAIPDDEPPLPPQNLIVENKDGRFIRITFSSSPSLDVKLYSLFRSETGQKAIKITSIDSVPFQYSDTSVVKGVSYSYHATALDSAENVSSPCKTESVLFRDFIPPPPVRLVKINSSIEGIELSWERVYDYDIAGYNIYRCKIATGIYEKANDKIIKELRFTDPNGSDDYFYKIITVDTSGNENDDIKPVHTD